MHLKMIQNKALLHFELTALWILWPIMPALPSSLVKILKKAFLSLEPQII